MLQLNGLMKKRALKRETCLWSHMLPNEQLNTLHALSEVTVHMSKREQMEVIKIIDPTAVIAPDDKEFALGIL
ncbi:hypothetical protein TNCT_691391 [Trichonephila clavata]|uniref:Uncharacterized protein n=1 Tax=Trichonephila clavata TaxID=2740835 RepID=A0A8X6FK58_TRICU|nr:hypothetical protein TNCT_691391 [Trichonephila clavata]